MAVNCFPGFNILAGAMGCFGISMKYFFHFQPDWFQYLSLPGQSLSFLLLPALWSTLHCNILAWKQKILPVVPIFLSDSYPAWLQATSLLLPLNWYKFLFFSGTLSSWNNLFLRRCWFRLFLFRFSFWRFFLCFFQEFVPASAVQEFLYLLRRCNYLLIISWLCYNCSCWRFFIERFIFSAIRF